MANRTWVLGAALLGAVLAERPLQAAPPAEPLLRPTPLVLKDGRIANASVHDVSFAHDRAELTAEADADLTELVRAIGTDCFLTAQVIGHVDTSETEKQDDLHAHRLARSRADAVQASLTQRGLPAKAISSIWDWHLLVREARATVWVFQPTEGQDCEGMSLNQVMVSQSSGQHAGPEPRPAVVPAIPSVEEASSPAPTRRTAEVPRQALIEPMLEPGGAETLRPNLQGGAIVSAAAAAERSREPQTETSQTPWELALGGRRDEVAQAPTVTQPLPAAASKNDTVATRHSRMPSREADLAADAGEIGRRPESQLIITFGTNSSYLTPETTSQLRRLLGEIDVEKRYAVSLEVAVSGTGEVVGAKSTEEAARYHKWLAERRLARVQRWLVDNAGTKALSIKPEYRSNDASRQVLLRLRPIT